MTSDKTTFVAFMQQREAAAGAYVCGDAAPLSGLAARTGDATFYAPQGGAVHGADAVVSTYEQGAAAFAPGSDNRFEILHMDADDRLGYWVGFQRASVRMHGTTEVVPFNLRVTEVFRRDGDTWKLIHRHADALAPAAPEENG